MPYSVVEGNQKEPKHFYQPFTQEEWAAYPFASEEDRKWFMDGKFGLFLSVGICALGQVDIGWSRHTHKMPDGGVGEVPDDVYDSWAEQFAFPNFDAKEWISIAKKGGMKYVVIIAKHHDGFHMWDTAYSNYKVTESPFGRDYMKELVDACHEQGLRVGIYYSQRDWVHPDYEPVDHEIAERIEDVPYYKLHEGETFRVGKNHKKYINYLHNTVKELMTNYGKIDMLWWDACWWGGMYLEEMWESDRLEREVRRLQPGILINNRASLPGDFDTPEGHVGFFQNERPWETCMPLGPLWAWTNDEPKSFRTVLHQFVNCVCGNGNYLLSIGARGDGTLDPRDTGRILEVGSWLEKYGESIYQTQGGPWLPGTWGGSTYNGKTIYLHILDVPENGSFVLPHIENTILNAVCLTGEDTVITQAKEGTVVEINLLDNTNDDVIIKLEMEKPVTEIIAEPMGNKFEQAPAVYGEKLVETIESIALAPSVEWVVPKGKLVTGIWIKATCEAELTVTAINGTEETEIWHGYCDKPDVEVDVMRYEAGAWINGKALEKIRVASNVVCKNVMVKIFGK